ncbi:MAG: AAA family ATPase [Myxococcota bacterium]|nr:AAA family ATPase [Myxococcota bacterium]
MDAAAPDPREIAAAWSDPKAWPDAESVETIQTHLSQVFLVDDRVYKLRKDVDLGFVDFGSRERRNADCLRELRLNRRLASPVYLGIAPVLRTANGIRLGPVAEELADGCEHVVVMRRLEAGRDARSLLRRQALDVESLEAVAERLAEFHASHRAEPGPAPAWREHVYAPMRANFEALRANRPEGLDAERLEALAKRFDRAMAAAAQDLDARHAEGLVVDGHGDLHLEHVWLLPEEPPLLIDCVEFSDELRRLDPASEVAFLAMDLRFEGRPDLAEAFLAAYARATDDYGLFRVVDLYQAYRAMVRAKVAALAAAQSSVPEEQRREERARVLRRIELTESLLAEREVGSVVVLCGTVGSGKTRVGRNLARQGAGVPIVADRVRKHEAGLSLTDRSGVVPGDDPEARGVDAGLYTPERRARVYAGLLERALAVTSSGRTAVLDAGYARRANRDAVRDWARDHGSRALLVEVRCDPALARRRLERRIQKGVSASDAGPELLETSLARYEPPTEWPPGDQVAVDSPEVGECRVESVLEALGRRA